MAVAELFLAAFLQVLFDKLMSRELLQFAGQEGVRSKLEKWRKMLLIVQAVLGDAEEKQLTDRAVKMWLDDLRDLAYDVEDILDEFATETLGRKLNSQPQSSSNKVRNLIPVCFTGLSPSVVKFNVNMGSKLKGVTGRLEELCKQRIELGLQMMSGGTSTVVWQRPPSTCLPEPAVYGREEDKSKILGMVLRDEASDSNFHVIPIVGMGGVGKTTLARLVYNDKAVEHFNLKAWVCVSDDFDVLRITKAILESVTSLPSKLKDLNQMQVQLQEAITGKKFLIVLDDVWSKNYSFWEALKSPFMVGAPGSKIILTTRSKDVALTIGPVEYYHLNLLSDDDCWSVFVKHASESRDIGLHQNMKLFRDKVVEKCRGLPLAARTLGGLLRSKQRDKEWDDILNSKIWDFSGESDILPVLRLSYHHLPSHLKRCFAYCAIFPKDYEFEEKELVLLWMAEGLIQQQGNKQAEDIGGEYFSDLLSRSVFQLSSSNGSKFEMHDLVNDLAQWISGETSFKLEDELGINRNLERFERIRHFSYTSSGCDGKNKFEVVCKVECLRTFLPVFLYGTPRRACLYVTNVVLSDLLSKFKKLRVLSLKNYYITELPDSIGGLRLLRYLNLSDTMIRSLPESTSSLYNLQTLILRGCRRLRKLPSDIGSLINLRYFDITGADLIKEMSLGIKQLKSLHVLSNFVVGKSSGSQIKDLENLKFLGGKLCISSLGNITGSLDTRQKILIDKKDLEVLSLEWGSQSDEAQNEVIEENVLNMLQPNRNLKGITIKSYGGIRFPSWIGDPSFSNIVVMRLESCEKCTLLPSLGLLGSLKHLMIKGMKGLKCIGPEIYGKDCSKPFQLLETLSFEDLQDWEHWDPIIFPCLRKLSIVKCHKFIGMLPQHLPLLEKLVIKGCPELVISFSSLPLLCELEIYGCKGMVCSSSTNMESISSMTLSNISEFGNWLKQGFKKVENLKIVNCEELIYMWKNEICVVKPPQTFHSLTSICKLHIEDCPRLVSLPVVSFLPILSELQIQNCKALTSLSEEMQLQSTRLRSLKIGGCHALTVLVKGQLPSSLKKLQIRNCEKLCCLMDDAQGDSSPSFSSSSVNSICTSLLQYLYIYNCPSLICLSSRGHLPKTLQQLVIRCCPKLECVTERFDNNMSLGFFWIWKCKDLKSIPDNIHKLDRLHEIYIWDCPSLVSFPGGGLPNTNLRVSIGSCEKLKALPNHMHSLNFLQELRIYQCPSIMSFPEEGFPTNLTSLSIEDLNIYKPLTEWGLHNLTSLRSLCIIGCPDAVSFPQEEMGMMLPSSLTELIIARFQKLRYLSSKGFQNLTSLEILRIRDCPELTSFPGAGLPSSLLQLYVNECPLLKKQCTRDKGIEWSKIADIPCVKVDEKFIYDP